MSVVSDYQEGLCPSCYKMRVSKFKLCCIGKVDKWDVIYDNYKIWFHPYCKNSRHIQLNIIKCAIHGLSQHIPNCDKCYKEI